MNIIKKYPYKKHNRFQSETGRKYLVDEAPVPEIRQDGSDEGKGEQSGKFGGHGKGCEVHGEEYHGNARDNFEG